MTLTHILVFSCIALLAGWVLPQKSRLTFLLIASVLGIYWLQPSTPIRSLDFWLPSASIFITVLVWAITQHPTTNYRRTTWITAAELLGIVLAVGLTRYTDPICCLTPSRPPEIIQIILVFVLALIVIASIHLLAPRIHWFSYVAIGIISIFFIILKTEPFSKSISACLRTNTGQPAELASALDIPWLGFSYLAFRLLHVLRDFQTGKLPSYSLGEFVTYIIFFPTFTAGPIDRIQRFMEDWRRKPETKDKIEQKKINAANTLAGGKRIVIGVFKKFVLADSLAVFALNPQNAAQTTSSLWMWILLLSYGLRIYFDFAGYTDIAIGLGRVIGFKLPENFERPYLKKNMTAFWNSWHITLAQWFRAYYFNPLTRALRKRAPGLPTWMIILVGQLSTMVLIGLWHGVAWNFLLWGFWHGLGLFFHNRWSNWIRPKVMILESHSLLSRISSFSGWLLTFLFVTLGWIWFALPSTELAWKVFYKLLGL